MAARILYGKELRQRIVEDLAEGIAASRRARMTLATLQAGESPDIDQYARAIADLAATIGAQVRPVRMPAEVGEKEFFAAIRSLNEDPAVTGLLVFSPLPAHLSKEMVSLAVRRSKDVEARMGLIQLDQDIREVVAPPTALAAVLMAELAGPVAGKEAVVIGRSDVVGKPAALLLLARSATVTVCHSKTRNLESHVRRADILIASAGRAGLVKGDWIKPGATVVDVGTNFVNGKTVGDVEFETAAARAGAIAPVPGGVGPVTNAILMQNLYYLYQYQEALSF